MSPRNATTDKVMSFGEHLDELRRRLMFAVGPLLPILFGAMYIGKPLMAWLITPLARALHDADQPPELIVTGVLEGFNSWFYLSLILTVLIGAPWLLYQLWLFIAPGLYSSERRFAYILAPLSLVLTVISSLFTYYVMLPVILAFFVAWNASIPSPAIATAALVSDAPALPTFPVLAADPLEPQSGAIWINRDLSELRVCMDSAKDGKPAAIRGVSLSGSGIVKQQLKLSSYIDLLLNFALAFAAGFQMPVVVLVLGWVGIVTPALLAKYRRHAIMVCAVLGAALTPGDPLSMVILTVPLVLLFEFGLLLLKLLPASRVAGDRPGRADEPRA